MKIKAMLLIIFSLICVSCKKYDEFSINEKKYVVYGNLRPGYELGYDDNNHAFLTDTRSHLQIVFICSSEKWDCTKENFLTNYDEAIKENRDMKEILSDFILEFRDNNAQKEEMVWSKHFKSKITRYYVLYSDVKHYFNI